MDLDGINQIMVDKFSPYPVQRWCVFGLCLLAHFVKILVSGTHHLIAYVVGVYLFHGFILFATPKDENIPDPFEEEVDNDNSNEYSPSNVDNSLRPFIRNMPEYTYWMFSMKVVVISFLLTLSKFTDIPVYTPILVVYFVFMVLATAIKLWQHSRKYNYNPFFQSKLMMME